MGRERTSRPIFLAPSGVPRLKPFAPPTRPTRPIRLTRPVRPTRPTRRTALASASRDHFELFEVVNLMARHLVEDPVHRQRAVLGDGRASSLGRRGKATRTARDSSPPARG